MERKEKGVVEREKKGKKKQKLEGGKKLKRGLILVGKRAGPSTPSSTWRLQFSALDGNNGNNPIQEFLNTTTTASARKLCANLWEIQPQFQLLRSKMSKNVGPEGASRGHRKNKKVFELDTRGIDIPSDPLDQPASAGPSKRHVAQPLIQDHQFIDRKIHALQPISSASCGSSVEVLPHKLVESPNSSLDFRGRIGESSYHLKTSAELLKVLNRIWSLEEHQTCNMSLLKSLKMELDHSQSQIKELLKEKQTNRKEMDDLMKQVAEDKIVRKNKEQDRIKAVIQSSRKEVEDERKLRKHSESLHRKLARELSEVKSAFSNALKELERERKARILLENLCDEFAKGIRAYEQEVRSLRHRPETDHVARPGKPDRLVLHISEAWLDERMQTRLAEAQNELVEKNTIVDKLSLDIETFLQARHSNELKEDSSFIKEAINNCSRRESFPLNEAVSAPRDAADEEDSIDSDSNCFELNKSTGKKQNTGNSKRRGNTNCSSESHLKEIKSSDTKKRMARKHARLNSNGVVDKLIRNHSLSSEGDRIHPESDLKEDCCVKPVFAAGHSSPVQKWISKLASPEFDKTESSLQLHRGINENSTLKEKLLEARLDSQKSRSKLSKASL
ncbi:hypothetical protein JCGZ_14307 [Jatropha curcas]|uniref:Uncharacterized protein n=2 Tax=Jatropha curcas TaxID=180498 RepID=A0A067JX41_JATCU|nr:hypothetical protein JCGZ_14307 [Jatropha curcas]